MDIPRSHDAGGVSEMTVVVGGDPVVVAYDPDHLAAHAADFAMSWSEVAAAIAASLDRSGTRVGTVHDGFIQPAEVGVTGILTVGSDDGAFWGYRPGRTIPSHLIAGEKEPTRELCVWGEWVAPDRFELWTCYPGGPAPREIHDPEIALDQLDEAIAFWAVHAIVVDPDEAEAMRRPAHG